MRLEDAQTTGFRVFINGNLFNEHAKVFADENAILFDGHDVLNITMIC